jgi:hypothetical protein
MSFISVSIYPVNAGLLCPHVYMDLFSLCGVNRVLQRQPNSAWGIEPLVWFYVGIVSIGLIPACWSRFVAFCSPSSMYSG